MDSALQLDEVNFFQWSGGNLGLVKKNTLSNGSACTPKNIDHFEKSVHGISYVAETMYSMANCIQAKIMEKTTREEKNWNNSKHNALEMYKHVSMYLWNALFYFIFAWALALACVS